MRIIVLVWALVALTIISPLYAQEEEAAATEATLRVLNLAADVEDLDTRTPSVWIAQDVAYLELSDGFSIDPGTHRIFMNDVEQEEVTVEAGANYALILRGSAEEETLAMQVVTLSTGDLLPSLAEITVINTLTDETSIDLYGSRLDWVRGLPATTDDSANVTTRSIAAGAHNLIVTEAGSRSNVLTMVDQVEFTGDTRYVIILTGAQEGLDLIITTGDRVIFNSAAPQMAIADAGTTGDSTANADGVTNAVLNFDGPAANLRILHLAPAAPMLDAYYEDTRIVVGINQDELSDFFQVPAGAGNLVIAASNTGINTNLFELFELDLRADSFTTIALLGDSASRLTSTVFPEVGIGSIYDLSAAVTFFHAIEDAPQIDIYGNNVKLVEGLNFPDENFDGAFTATITAGDFEFEVTEAFRTDPIIFLAQDVPLAGDTPYLFVLTGDVDDPELRLYGPEGVLIRTLADLPQDALATATP